jgi:peroxiredoxin
MASELLLPVGSPAPAFLLRRSLHEASGLRDSTDAPLVLLFYPGVWEPVTSSELSLYQEHLEEIHRLGARLLGVSVDHFWSQLAFAKLHRIEFPLLSDCCPKGEVARMYGVYQEDAEVSRRALFVVDRTGTVRWSRSCPYSLNPGVDGVLSVLERMHRESSEPVQGT